MPNQEYITKFSDKVTMMPKPRVSNSEKRTNERLINQQMKFKPNGSEISVKQNMSLEIL